MGGQQAISTFVSFPDKAELLNKLHALEVSRQEHEPLLRLVAERLDCKAYDRSAFVFILIELVYEFEDISGGDLEDLLAAVVTGLTNDPELAESALDAYGEIKATLEPEPSKDESSATTEPAVPEPAVPEPAASLPAAPLPAAPQPAVPKSEIDEAFLDEAFPVGESEPPLIETSIGPYVARQRTPDQEQLMHSLQDAQKQLVDLGLSTRMSIDMTLSRANPESVSHTLREISTLRAVLRGFEDLLSEAQERILEKIEVLDKD